MVEFPQYLGEYDIVGIGVSTLDILTVVEHFPLDDSVQRAENAKFQGGGPVTTALVTAANMGGKVAMIDSLGNDFAGKYILNELKEFGVICNGVQITNNTTSSIASIWVRKQDGKRSIAFYPGNAPILIEEKAKIDIIKKAKILHVNGRHLDFCINSCRIAQENNIITSFDGGKGRYRSELDRLIQLIDIFIIASDFAYKYSETTSIENAAQCFMNLGSKLVVITDGEQGSFIFTESEYFHQPAFLIENTVDTTGCGDVYHGVFLLSISRGFSLRKAAKLASAAAAIKAQYLGGRGKLPTMLEIEAFLRFHNSDSLP